tara:strand:- start:128 stop:343 length:216 start_codon:yes stop_codon:yes gene_type:complete
MRDDGPVVDFFLILAAGFAVATVIRGLVKTVSGSGGGGKKNKMFKYNFGYIGLIIILLVGLGLGGAVNSMM